MIMYIGILKYDIYMGYIKIWCIQQIKIWYTVFLRANNVCIQTHIRKLCLYFIIWHPGDEGGGGKGGKTLRIYLSEHFKLTFCIVCVCVCVWRDIKFTLKTTHAPSFVPSKFPPQSLFPSLKNARPYPKVAWGESENYGSQNIVWELNARSILLGSKGIGE